MLDSVLNSTHVEQGCTQTQLIVIRLGPVFRVNFELPEVLFLKSKRNKRRILPGSSGVASSF